MKVIAMLAFTNGSMIAGLLVMLPGLAWAAASDIRHYQIPNRACALVAGSYLLALAALPLGGWIAGLVTGVAVLALGAVLFARGWVGGGDVKLAAAVALWAGPALLAPFAQATSLAAVVLALVLLSPLRARLPRVAGAASVGLNQPMPFGLPLAVGGALVAALRLHALV